MNSKKTIKKILIALAVVIALLVVYSLFAQNQGAAGQKSNSSLSSLVGGSALGQVRETDVTLANAEILKILGSIKDIQLDDDIFSNPVFTKLKDNRFIIPKPVRIGRPNPFLPLGFDFNQQAKVSTIDQDPNSTDGQDPIEQIGFFDQISNPADSQGGSQVSEQKQVDLIRQNQ